MLLASVRTCCLRGSTGPQGASAPPLPYPTAASMLAGRVLPWLLELECDALFDLGCEDWPAGHRFAADLLACYEALLRACAAPSAGYHPSASARGKRWEIPLPAVGGALAKLVVDSRLNKWVAAEAGGLFALQTLTLTLNP